MDLSHKGWCHGCRKRLNKGFEGYFCSDSCAQRFSGDVALLVSSNSGITHHQAYRDVALSRVKDKNEERKQKSRARRGHYRIKSRVQKYGMSLEEYDKILSDQGGKCACCGSKRDDDLNIDHCHRTGRVRGLLCRDCNLGLGYFRDSVSVMERAIKYLEKKRG